ncbi:MAG: hypothetical protein IT256_02030, partial [Chitinophagaceae bacterium]|nr:hypothetical protein [Chitinophagaceae bacterium]
MKKSIITLSFLSTAMLSFAQEVTIKKDIIYKNGEPYCKMIKKGSIVKDYTLSTLEGTTFLELRYNVK